MKNFSKIREAIGEFDNLHIRLLLTYVKRGDRTQVARRFSEIKDGLLESLKELELGQMLEIAQMNNKDIRETETRETNELIKEIKARVFEDPRLRSEKKKEISDLKAEKEKEKSDLLNKFPKLKGYDINSATDFFIEVMHTAKGKPSLRDLEKCGIVNEFPISKDKWRRQYYRDPELLLTLFGKLSKLEHIYVKPVRNKIAELYEAESKRENESSIAKEFDEGYQKQYDGGKKPIRKSRDSD